MQFPRDSCDSHKAVSTAGVALGSSILLLEIVIAKRENGVPDEIKALQDLLRGEIRWSLSTV